MARKLGHQKLKWVTLNNMQLVRQKGETIEKVFTDKSGRLVRAKFFVYEREGRLKAKLLNFTYLEQIVGKVSDFLLDLYKNASKKVADLFKIHPEPIFTSLKIYNFTGSKPRAPTL